MSGKDYRQLIFEFARDASDEEFERVVGRFDALVGAISEFGKALQIFNPILAHPIEKTVVEAEGLCSSCARPCKLAKPATLTCKQYREYKEELCKICENYDEVCQSADPCEGGSMFCPEEQEERVVRAIPV